VAEQSLDEAKVHTDNMINDATKKSEDMINKAKKEVEINKEISERLKSESAKLREKLDAIYKKHLEIIDEIPADVFAKSEKNELDSECCKKENKVEEEAPAADISKSVTSNIRKRFFEIDAKIGRDVSSGLAEAGRAAGRVENNIFSDEDASSKRNREDKRMDRFKNLQFGRNFDMNGKKNDSTAGAYSGMFRK
jgi:hypothetical protein